MFLSQTDLLPRTAKSTSRSVMALEMMASLAQWGPIYCFFRRITGSSNKNHFCAVFVLQQKQWVNLQRVIDPRKLSKGQFKRMLMNKVDGKTSWGFLVWLKSLEGMYIKRKLMFHKKQVLILRRKTSACYRLPTQKPGPEPSLQCLSDAKRNIAQWTIWKIEKERRKVVHRWRRYATHR